ncbi:MAG: 50S ribosomal protein L25 [Phycisphaerae bacterium]|nr:50S ribosomal protein L25 [Phycisphaerae bacterium]
MEKRLLLEAEVRGKIGTKGAVLLRQNGRLPAVVYGHKQVPESVSLNAHEFERAVHHGHRVLDLKISGKVETLMVKDLQYDFLGRDIIHADLVRVDISETVKVSVPIELKGTAKGLHEGGMIEEHADVLEIECVVTNIPETIVVSVKDVGVGDALYAGDVTLPAGVTLVSPTDTLVVTCPMKAAAVSAEEEGEAGEEGPATPEVITERKSDED